MSSFIDLLLATKLPEPKTKTIKIKRLSEHFGQPVLFEIKEIGYNQVHNIKELNSSPISDMAVAIILEGVVSPNLREQKLLDELGVPTPVEAVLKILNAGEIEELQREIEKLSGYRQTTLDMIGDIKKK